MTPTRLALLLLAVGCGAEDSGGDSDTAPVTPQAPTSSRQRMSQP